MVIYFLFVYPIAKIVKTYNFAALGNFKGDEGLGVLSSLLPGVKFLLQTESMNRYKG
jgi:hypothetical protein